MQSSPLVLAPAPARAPSSEPRSLGKLAMAFLVCFAASAIGGLFTATSVGSWYLEIQRPSWNPPSWVFGPVWTSLYAMMAVALWQVWRSSKPKGLALKLFAAQLFLNVLWSILFFGLKSPGLALVDIVLLVLCIAATSRAFYRVRPVAGLLLLPYLLWTSFATVLNGAIWSLN